MTGKELVIVLAGMALAAGGAGVGVAVYSGGDDAPVDRTAEILERFDGLDAAIEKTASESRRNRRTLENISDRLTEVELGLDRVDRAQAGAARTGGVVRDLVTGEVVHGGSDESVATDVSGGMATLPTIRLGGNGEMAVDLKDALAGASKALEGLDIELPDDARAQLAEAFGENSSFADMIAGAQRGMELRQLPEAERWEKAQQELGLGFNQIEELKSATAERDAAMKDAMVVERDEETEDGGRFLMKRMDHTKAAEAQARYDDRLNQTLTPEQRKDWNRKGYGNAFGSTGGGMGGPGGATVISVTSTTSTTTNTTEDVHEEK